MKAPVDLLIYPAAFSYRHGIELMLKDLILSLKKVSGKSGAFKKNHKMKQLWSNVVRLNSLIKEPLIESEAITQAGDIIISFNEFDPTGQVFRYPEDINGNPHLKDHKIINVEVLMRYMTELQAILERWHYQAEGRL